MSQDTLDLYFFFETDVSGKIEYQNKKINYDKDFFKKYIDTCKKQLEKILRDSTEVSLITIQDIKSVLIIDKTLESGEGGVDSSDSGGSSSKTTIKLRIYVPVNNNFASCGYNYVTEHDNVSLYTVDIHSASTQTSQPSQPQLQRITPRTPTQSQTQTSTQQLIQKQKRQYKKLKFVYRYVKKNILLEPLFFIYKTSDQQNQQNQQVQVNKIIYRIKNSNLVLAIPSIDPYTSFPSVQDKFSEICNNIEKIQIDYKLK